MPGEVLTGRAWKFDHDISTDVLSPGQFAVDPLEVRMQHCLESVNPAFASEVQAGDIVVAGRNFGCGSSRETAPENLKALGVSCVVAESFSRLFMRNSVALGLPVVVCAGIHDSVSDGESVVVDLVEGVVTIPSSGEALRFDSLPPEMLRILDAGGILAVLADRGHR